MGDVYSDFNGQGENILSKVKISKIFLLDEDQDLGPKLIDILERAGYRPKWFIRREDMQKHFDKEIPDLFIVSPFFAHDEGIKFLYARKKDEILNKIPAVAISDMFDGYTIAQLQAIGVKDYLVKPLNAKYILNLCKRILSKESVKSYNFDADLKVLAYAPLNFIKISETTIQAESPVKLTDDVDGSYRVISEELAARGIVDQGLYLSRNTTFVSNDGQFRAFFRMRGLREETLQMIRGGKF